MTKKDKKEVWDTLPLTILFPNMENFFVFSNLAVGKPFQGLRSGGGMKHEELTPVPYFNIS